MNNESLKATVREKYSEIAGGKKEDNENSCCGPNSCCSSVDYTIFSESYEGMEGYDPEADLGLGCGIPTAYALIREGDTVIDLGSGAGNDCFVARTLVGEKGKVIGIDMTPAMIEKARENSLKLGYKNVEFRLGDIENMPLHSDEADVIISNCVLNLVPEKVKAFGEIFRILKPGGHISISDVVLKGSLPEGLASDAEMYAGCVAGAIDKQEYLDIMSKAGLVNISVKKEREIVLPDEILIKYLGKDELERFRNSDNGIFSISLYAEKSK